MQVAALHRKVPVLFFYRPMQILIAKDLTHLLMDVRHDGEGATEGVLSLSSLC